MIRLNALASSRRSGTVVIVGVALAVLLLFARGITTDWIGAWGLLPVPAALPSFLDMHHVADVLPCAARGMDVYRDASCDVQHRPFNYPPIWLELRRLGIGGGDTASLALGMEAAALMVLLLLLRGRTLICGFAALLALASPSVAVGFERGNNDLLVFVLVGAAALLLGRPGTGRIAASAALVLGAIMLKLYPVALCASFVRDRRWATAMGAVAVAGLAYGLSILDFLPLVRANTFQIGGVYGATALFAVPIGDRLGAELGPVVRTMTAELAAFAVFGAAALAARVVIRRGIPICDFGNDAASASFQFGAAIYCLTFLLGANLAYRLVFLLLLLPLLFDWIEHGPRETRTAALALLLLAQAVFWLTIGTDFQELASQGVHWLLFAGLAFVTWRDVMLGLVRLRRNREGRA